MAAALAAAFTGLVGSRPGATALVPAAVDTVRPTLLIILRGEAFRPGGKASRSLECTKETIASQTEAVPASDRVGTDREPPRVTRFEQLCPSAASAKLARWRRQLRRCVRCARQ